MDFTIVSQIHRPLSFGDSFDLLFPSKSRWISQNLPKSIDFSYFWLDVLFVRDTSVRNIVVVLPVWDRHDTSCVFQTGLDVLSLCETTPSCYRNSRTYKHATGMFALRRGLRFEP